MYFDPGVGSLVVQALIGVLVSLPVLAGIYWKKLVRLVKRKHDTESS